MINKYLFPIITGVLASLVFMFSFIEYSNNYKELSANGYSDVLTMLDKAHDDKSFHGLVNMSFTDEYISVKEFRLILDTFFLSHGTLVSNGNTEESSDYFKQKINARLINDFTKG